MLRPRLKRTVDAVESAAGDIYILRPGADSDLVIEQPDRIARGLLAALDGSRSAAELEREFGDERCARRSRISPAPPCSRTPPTTSSFPRASASATTASSATSPTSPRPARRPPTTTGASARRASPCLASAGSAAGRPTRSPAAAWVSWPGRRRPRRGEQLQPPDPLSRARHRQAQGRGRRRGAGRVRLGLRAHVDRAPPGGRGRDLGGHRGADFVVNAADWPAHDIERWTNAACFAAGLPFITMSHAPPVARVGPLYAPGTTGCYACQEESLSRLSSAL